ncbi:hypothetical protein B7463_g3153, partial [Scytalidium lignicola]
MLVPQALFSQRNSFTGTPQSKVEDRLIDEGIHLVSACQLAGFRPVVGTLWEVSDKHCVDVAKVLYETIRDEGMTDEALYQGLHRAVRALRDGILKEDSNQSNMLNKDSLQDTMEAEDDMPATVMEPDSWPTDDKEEIEMTRDQDKEDTNVSGHQA